MLEPHPISYYLNNVEKRNLLQPMEQKAIASVISSENTEISRKIANWKLVGIAWLDTVESASVMIEDTSANVTHFLKKGEKLGDILVKTIYADRAVLGYENEEIEIRYDKSEKENNK